MAKFLYLYSGGEAPETPAEGQEVMQKWRAWMKELDEAVEASKGCPIFHANAAIEVRPILQLNM